MVIAAPVKTQTENPLYIGIIGVLNYHIGRENPITAVDIGERLGYGKLKNTYIIREAISELITLGYPVCSDGDGFFMAKDLTEVAYFAEGLRIRGVKIILRRRDLLRAGNTWFNGAEQHRLF